jgi:elongation factor Ts
MRRTTVASASAVTTKLIAELRARTGAGMMDCKKALEETHGDLEQAVELLRRKGQAKGEKRAGREASQGVVAAHLRADGTVGALVELDSETDFVARTDEFGRTAREVARHLAETADAARPVAELPLPGDPTRTVGDLVRELAGKTGENVVLRRSARFALEGGTGLLEHYVHFNAQVGVLLELAAPAGASDALRALAKDLTLHIASAKPIAVTTDQVEPDVIARERRIYEAQVADEGKPDAVRAKIVEGRVRKFYEERVLLEQAFVKDDKVRVKDLVLRAGAGVAVRRFACFAVSGD